MDRLIDSRRNDQKQSTMGVAFVGVMQNKILSEHSSRNTRSKILPHDMVGWVFVRRVSILES
jgi:hypothetical protein